MISKDKVKAFIEQNNSLSKSAVIISKIVLSYKEDILDMKKNGISSNSIAVFLMEHDERIRKSTLGTISGYVSKVVRDSRSISKDEEDIVITQSVEVEKASKKIKKNSITHL